MKKILLFAFGAWLMAIGKVAADNTLSVANVTIPQGGQATVTITCDFSTTFVGGQWDLELSEDGKLTPNMSEGKPVASFGFTSTDHSISSSQLKDGEQQLLPKYRFVFTSLSQAALPTSGTLMTIVLNASETATVGTIYNAKLSNIELGTSGNSKVNPADIAFTVTIDEPLETVTLDETDATIHNGTSGPVNVTVNRTIKAGEWSTICLPFDMTTQQVTAAFGNDVKLADFTSWSFEGTPENVTKITIGFTDVNRILKNHPYLIKVPADIESFNVYNVQLFKANATNSVVIYDDDDNQYIGSMVGVRKTGTVTNNHIFLSNNKFYYSNGSTNIKAYRATFNFGNIVLNEVNASRIVMSFGDDATDIGDAARLTNSEDVNSKLFNLSGQRVDTPKKGIYVKGGKKVIMK